MPLPEINTRHAIRDMPVGTIFCMDYEFEEYTQGRAYGYYEKIEPDPNYGRTVRATYLGRNETAEGISGHHWTTFDPDNFGTYAKYTVIRYGLDGEVQPRHAATSY